MKNWQLTSQILAAVAVTALTATAHAQTSCRAQAIETEKAILKVQLHRRMPVKVIAAREIKDDIATVQVFDVQAFEPKTHAELRAFSRLEFAVEGESCTLFKYSIPNAN